MFSTLVAFSSVVLALTPPIAYPKQDPLICVLKEQKYKNNCCVNQFDATYNITQLATNGSAFFHHILKCNPQVGDDGIFLNGTVGFMPCNIKAPKNSTFADEFGVNHADIYIICEPSA